MSDARQVPNDRSQTKLPKNISQMCTVPVPASKSIKISASIQKLNGLDFFKKLIESFLMTPINVCIIHWTAAADRRSICKEGVGFG
jgi:hypothetical protein